MQPLGSASPFFIVADIDQAIAFYRDKLRFEVRYQTPVFAIVGRDATQIMLKYINEYTPALPNSARHPWASWDAFIYTANPHAYAAELGKTAQNTEDGLTGFALADADGYVLFFGRPIPEAP